MVVVVGVGLVDCVFAVIATGMADVVFILTKAVSVAKNNAIVYWAYTVVTTECFAFLQAC